MEEKELRLGDEIDDYCTRCRLLTNHGVVTILDGKVGKVRCNTCYFEHTFRHAKGGRKKKEDVKSLFEQVLKTMPKQASARNQQAQEKTQKPPKKR